MRCCAGDTEDTTSSHGQQLQIVCNHNHHVGEKYLSMHQIILQCCRLPVGVRGILVCVVVARRESACRRNTLWTIITHATAGSWKVSYYMAITARRCAAVIRREAELATIEDDFSFRPDSDRHIGQKSVKVRFELPFASISGVGMLSRTTSSWFATFQLLRIVRSSPPGCRL
jgi:hypothetical protein